VSYTRISALLTHDQTAVSAANQFWADSKLLLEQKRGVHLPSPELVEWAHAFRVDPASAWSHLNGKFREAWYGDWIQKKLRAVGSIQREQLVKGLTLVAGGDSEETEARTRMLVDLLVQSNFLVETQPGVLVLGGSSSPPSPPVGPDPLDVADTSGPNSQTRNLGLKIEGAPSVGPQNVDIGVEVNTAGWPVGDVIRLLEYLKTGKDPNGGDKSNEE